MKAFTLDNLSTSSVSEVDFYQMFHKSWPAPPSHFSEEDWQAWRVNGDTKYCFYSLFEGVTSSMRITEKGNNPPFLMHGFVADYDTKITNQVLQDGLKNQDPNYPVGHVEFSKSGGVHLIWEFDQPFHVTNPKLLQSFLKRFVIEAKVKKLLPGYDPKSSSSNLYYTLGTHRQSLGKTVSVNMMKKIAFDVSQSKGIFKDQNDGVELPFDVIEREVEKRYPGRWNSPFAEGARGVRFWDATAKDTTACEMHSTGCYVFSSEDAGFKSWGELLGSSVVKKYEADQISQAVGNIYYDGASFWDLSDDGWHKMGRSDVTCILKNTGLSSKGSPSEIEKAFFYIIKNHRVEGNLPFIYCKQPTIHKEGRLWLNTSNVQVMPMADVEVKTWKDERIKWITSLLNSWWAHDEEQMEYWLAWVRYFYISAYLGMPQKGQAAFVVGGAGTGKTFVSTRLLSLAFGGHTDVSNFLQGRDQFNEHLFRKGLLCIDDDRASSDYRKRMGFASMVKSLVANHDQQMRKMYQNAVDITYKGRLVVTSNKDAESLQILPSLDISNRDKLMFFNIPDSSAFEFPVDPKTGYNMMEMLVKKELPYFLRFLYDYEPDPEVMGDSRFGVKSYIHPELAEASAVQSFEVSLEEMLDDFRVDYFRDRSKETEAHFTSTQLLNLLCDMFQHKMLEGLTPTTFPKRVNTLISRGNDWIEARVRKGKRGFVVKNPHCP